jgi:hypothetical protein
MKPYNSLKKKKAMKLSEVIKHIGEKFSHPLTLVDINLPDQPVIYANTYFSELTKYENDQILNRNCRFLRGELTSKEDSLKIRQAISLRKPICQDILNYKKGGDVFYNRLVLIPFKEGKDLFYLGLQHEIAQENYRTDSYISDSELLDIIINRLTVILSLKNHPQLATEDEFIDNILRIRNYVLSL